MPDKAIGWRKKIHSKPKDINSSNASSSRPGTPVRAGTPTLPVDTEDTRSARPEPSTPRRPPTLARLVTGYRNLKDISKDSDFAEPWGEDATQYKMPSTDPLVSMQSIYTHMNTLPTRPISIDCNSALFHIFEDYRRVRAERDGVERLLKKSFESLRKAEEALIESESQHRAEIRRLELLMMRGGVSSLAGLIKVRQGSLIKRRRVHLNMVSAENLQTAFEGVPMSDLDEQIRSKSQHVLLQRPSSPSGKMAALSRKFSRAGSADDLHIGTAPSQKTTMYLSRKVKSELDLSNIGKIATSSSVPPSTRSDMSQKSDSSPDDAGPSLVPVNPGLECDAVVALQALGTLVARKKGINTDHFVDGLMHLLMLSEHVVEDSKETEMSRKPEESHGIESSGVGDDGEGDQLSTPKLRLRSSRSQPQLEIEHKRRRHFSFEPGDDDIKKLEGNTTSSTTIGPASSKDVVESDSARQHDTVTSLERQMSSDLQKPSKIPSPLQHPGVGSIRRENSSPGVQHDDRRTSISSIRTAFRQNSGGSVPLTSRNESNRVAAIAAARAAKKSSGVARSENELPRSRSRDHA